ncbi:Major facilitator superfamily like protein, partial [Aduncisulcus paluster]
MMDILPVEQRQSGFSLSYLGINIGVAVGPIVAGFLFNRYLKWLFIGDAITTAIAVFLVLVFIPTQKHEDIITGSADEQSEQGSLWAALARRPLVIVFLLLNVLYALTYAQHSFALPITLNQLFLDDGPRNFGFLMSVNAITCVAMTILITHLTRKLKPIQ